MHDAPSILMKHKQENFKILEFKIKCVIWTFQSK